MIFFRLKEGAEKYKLDQEMVFETPTNYNLYHYPLSIDGNMLALSVANEVFIYTQEKKKWKRESLVLPSNGDYAGYVASSVGLSGGHLLFATTRDVNAHDFTSCARETPAPTPTLVVTFSPTSPPTETEAVVTLPPTAFPTSSPTPLPTAMPTPLPTQKVTASPTTGPQGDCVMLDVSVSLDQYPSDTRWEIKSKKQNKQIIAESRPYDNSLMFLPDSQSVCLEEGEYEFTIYDKYGDGM